MALHRVFGIRTCMALALSGQLLCCSVGAADVVYVDAASGAGANTTLADGSDFNPPLNGTTGNDNNWEQRTVFGSSGNVFESAGEGAAASENAPELRTTISGLTPFGTYAIYAYFWDPTSAVEDWNLRAGFSSSPGANTLFARADALGDFTGFGTPVAAGLASGQVFTSAPTIFIEGGRDLLVASLGQIDADANGVIRVFVDDLHNGTTGAGNVNRRTWFDGVGFEAVPEPSTALLFGAVLVGMGIQRKRRIV